MSTGRVGYWVSEKKGQKLDFASFGRLCQNAGLDLVKLDLDRPLEEQGPFDSIVHKISDVVLRVESGNEQAKKQLFNFTEYVRLHPDTFLVDSLSGLVLLMDRGEQYRMLQECCTGDPDLFAPPFVELTSLDVPSMRAALLNSGIDFPVVCKPLTGQGSNQAHQMCVVFSEKGLADVRVPSVAQAFVAHNAVLHKVFVVGDVIRVVERPSLRNLDSTCNDETIFFDSHDVSKPDCCTELTQLDAEDKASAVYSSPPTPVIQRLITSLRQRTQLNLLSVDVIVQKDTGRCAVIDVNSFPGYEGVPDFFTLLLNYLISRNCVLRSAGEPRADTTPEAVGTGIAPAPAFSCSD